MTAQEHMLSETASGVPPLSSEIPEQFNLEITSSFVLQNDKQAAFENSIKFSYSHNFHWTRNNIF